MLNVSDNRIEGKVDTKKYYSFSMVKHNDAIKIFSRLIIASFIIGFIVILLPWTQNIRSNGYVTTLKPGQRPQQINTVIAGKIEKWYVQEGDYVMKGDTIVFISEIKDDYFDPNLIERTKLQIGAKEQAIVSYNNKVKALQNQLKALEDVRVLKLQQARNYLQQAELKIQSDSIDLGAANTNYQIAEKQYNRIKSLYESGLKSLTDLEIKKQKLQETQAKKISAENKLINSRNLYINAKVELTSIENQYKEKISKVESDKYATLSTLYDAEASLTKMRNQLENYSVRRSMLHITAPQSGYITKSIKSGIGETIKEGDQVVTIMPEDYQLAVSMYIKPMDVPLLQKGQKIRFMFDGWPSIVFSGWPNLSYGTFGGKVVAIDNFTSDNGKYRILVAPDPQDHPWPDQLRVGSGANGFALLGDVPIWYELWRKLNGFPPNFYEAKEEIKERKTAEK